MIKLTFEFASKQELGDFLAKLNYNANFTSVKSEDTAKNDSFDIEPFVFETEHEAREFMNEIRQLIEKYSNVSVADAYDMIHKRWPHGYTDCKYGWTRMDSIKLDIDYNKSEYIVTFDKPVKL